MHSSKIRRDSRIQYFAATVTLFLVYFVTARLGLQVGAVNQFAALVWPPTGISLAALLIFGLRLWPAIGLGAFLVNWSLGAPIFVALGMGAGNALEAVAGAYLLQQIGFQRSFSRLRDVFSLILLAAISSTLLSATFGVFSLFLGGKIPPGTFQSTWMAWWIGDIMGDLLVAPFLLVWSEKPWIKRPSLLRAAEITGFGLVVIGSSLFLFTDFLLPNATLFPRPYLIFPLLMVVAVRLEQKWTVTAILTIATIALWATATGHGKFEVAPLSLRLFQVQIFLGVIATSTMTFAATLMERKQREAEIRRAGKNQRFLNQATRLLSESIDYRTTLKHVAQAAIPEFADYCLVHVLSDDGIPKTVELACRLPEKEALLQKLSSEYYSDLEGPTILAFISRTRQSRLIPEATEETYRSLSKDTQHLELLRRLGVRSLIGCPLVFHDRFLGAIVAGSLQSDRTYGLEDVALLEELARRAAIAIENARLYREAQEAVFARDEFLSIASHELRTPLTSLSLQLQMFDRALKKGISERVKQQAQGQMEMISIPLRTATLASGCDEQVKKLSALLDDLLDLTRIRLGRLQLEKEKVDLCAVVREIAKQFNMQASQTGVRISVQCESDATGCWDRIRIEQIVSNLISNALKYGERKPVSVTVSQDVSQGTVKLVVQDRGQGIARELIGKIFERFERAGVTGQKIAGLGLGLYICRQIVEAHGGHIQVESDAGSGSTFTVELPVGEAGTTEQTQSRPADTYAKSPTKPNHPL